MGWMTAMFIGGVLVTLFGVGSIYCYVERSKYLSRNFVMFALSSVVLMTGIVQYNSFARGQDLKAKSDVEFALEVEVITLSRSHHVVVYRTETEVCEAYLVGNDQGSYRVSGDPKNPPPNCKSVAAWQTGQ